jgi:hypothetical protein
MRSQLARAPQVDRDLTAMQRDYEVAQTKFEDIRSQQRSAQIASSLIDTQSGARFSIVEPPILPEYPVSSGRKKTVALGVIAAVVAALGLAALLETLFPRVRGENAITAITGAKPLVVIPYIKNSQDTRAIRDLKKKLMWSALAAVSLALIFINFALQPLPELLSGIVGFRD